MTDRSEREVLFEFVRVGNAIKVTAIDAATGIEASIVGAVGMGEAMLKRNALRRLDYVLRKRAEGR